MKNGGKSDNIAANRWRTSAYLAHEIAVVQFEEPLVSPHQLGLVGRRELTTRASIHGRGRGLVQVT